MAKKCPVEFNPWPPFVDLFSSVILVLILFLLVLIVEIAYYAQFKFKITYEGKVIEREPIKNSTPTVKVDHIIKKHTEATKATTAIEQALIIEKNSTLNPKFTFEETSNITKKDATLESGGYKLKDMRDINKTTTNLVELDKNLLVIKYDKSKTIMLKADVISNIKKYIKKYISKHNNYKIFITTKEPSNIFSATISKQISLGRAISLKSLIAKIVPSKLVRLNLFNKEFKNRLSHKAGVVFLKFISKDTL